MVDTDEARTEVKARIKEYLIAHPGHGTKEKWIRGIGWDQAYFGGVMPTAVDIPWPIQPIHSSLQIITNYNV